MNANEEADLNLRLGAATEALRRAEARATAGQFALEMIHEIKNPLEALGHLVYLAREEASDSEKVTEYMHEAEEQMALLRHVTRQTLGFTRSTQSPRTIEGITLAEAALRIHHRTITDKKIRLVKDLPEGLVAKVYTGEILQVLSNVIVNALDALPEHGTLRLRLSKHHGKVHFLVADNGHGIEPHHLANVFEPFFTTKDEGGTGLGLALSKKIVERHQGSIRIRSSVRSGKSGTTFRISLPA